MEYGIWYYHEKAKNYIFFIDLRPNPEENTCYGWYFDENLKNIKFGVFGLPSKMNWTGSVADIRLNKRSKRKMVRELFKVKA